MPSSTMQKITEKLLIERGFPKSSKLEQIHSLKLSKLGLRCEDLPVPLLSHLVCLERLDLSGNRLTEFPAALCLPSLKHLDLSDNQMEDVCNLQCLSALEELCLDDNLYITVSDNYKLMVLLPQLRMYNGKDITATANHLRYVYTDNLQTRIISLWERSFSLPQPMSADKLTALEADFVRTAKQQVKFGPSSVSDFTKWRVGIMAAEFFKFQTQQKDQPHRKESTTDQDSENANPLKRKRAVSPVAVTKQTPAKKASIVPVSQIRESPRKSALQLTGQRQNQSTHDLCKSSTPPSSPRTTRKSKQDSVSHQPSSSPAKHLLPRAKSPNEKPVCLRTHHVLQCHSKQDRTDDLSTQLWTCAFQPSDGSSRLVATCGGDSVCLIDCELGLVMKKYKVSEEEFFSLAWTTVLMCCGQGTPAQPCSVLAAGGKRGMVKLIHPRNNIAYGEFRASRKALSVLRFNPNKGNFLYTGSYDNKIVLWDIGGLDNHYNYKVVQLMSLECNSTPLHLCVPPKAPLSHLLTACDNGLHCYSTQVQTTTTTNRWKQREVTFPVYKDKDSEHDYHTVDGLSFLSDDIVASKNYMHRSIYLWSFSQTLAQQPHKKTGCVSAVVLAELQWTSTQVPYLALNTCPGQCYVVCGDDRGRLWTYHIKDLKDKSIAPQILEWPSVRNDKGPVEGPSINSVAMDPELQYLVALTDCNLVVVWRREETES
ncbi:leucine-rich repeat and WD repeat-containing protein 1 isoform X2 [Boleophthalmus pectinirostris]|uniref:leucine-rich repeat and WD repeat-containing protein 1 isoform X2 n=1 Tax=Boleophthalmus pectinirostris TaxID=150288 RepID=UPI002432B051|nr:leucine-rich repeat and WD repeat-containing protein 1 isoform X2 [Boleophthalmus pectinirostris]